MHFGNSNECTKSELDLFSIPPTQTSIEEGVWDTVWPHANYHTSTIQFDIPSTSSSYVDMSETELYITAKIEKVIDNKGENMAATDKIGPVNNLFHSIFQQIEVFFNNTSVENTNSTYPYKAYFENLLNYDKESKETFLSQEKYVKDVAGLMNSTTLVGTENPKPNAGFVDRREPFSEGKLVEMKGRIHSDVFNLDRYLLNNVNICIKLTRHSNYKFYLMGASTDEFRIYIERAFLKVRRVKISPSVMMAHSMALEKSNAKYPIKRTIVKPITIPQGSTQTTLGAIHNGMMPNRVVFGFVFTNTFTGDLTSTPFDFQNHGISNLTLKMASKAVPYSSALDFDFGNNQYIQGYNTLFQGIRQAPNDISYADYKSGYTLFAFDLTPDLCSADHFNLLHDGSLDLDITFSKAPDKSITAIFYLEFDNIIEITKNRQILFDYKI